MTHKIFRVQAFQIVESLTLSVLFDDDTEQVIDFEPILRASSWVCVYA